MALVKLRLSKSSEEELVRLHFQGDWYIDLPIGHLKYLNSNGLWQAEGHSLDFWIQLFKSRVAKLVRVLPKSRRKEFLRAFRSKIRVVGKALRRICSGLAKLGASARHGASLSFLCSYLYPTPREELA